MTSERCRRLGIIALLVTLALAAETASSRPAFGAPASPAPPFAWNVETANASQGAGLYTSIALDRSGRPYISYVNDVNGTFSIASETGGNWSSELVAGPGSFDGNTNVVIAPNSTMEVSYYDAYTGMVMFGAKGPGGWAITRIDSGFSDGYNRLALDSAGDPGIAYTGFDGALRYAAWNGSAWSLETADRETLISRYEDLAFDALGRPHISYYGNGTLLEAVRTFAGWTRETVDPTEFAGWYSRIRIDPEGLVHIAYYASANGSLMYATDGPTGWTHTRIDSGADDGYDISLAIDPTGRPQIAYYERLTGSLKYAIGTDQGWVRETVDLGGVTGWYTGIAVDEFGLPHISYYDWSDSVLRYAQGIVALQVRSLGTSQPGTGSAVLQGELVALGNHSDAMVGFDFRLAGSSVWEHRSVGNLTAAGVFAATLTNLTTNATYEFRATGAAGTETTVGSTLRFGIAAPPPPPPPNLLLPAGLASAIAVAAVSIALWHWRRRRPKKRQPRPVSYAAR